MESNNEELDNSQDDITPQDFDVLMGQRRQGFHNHPGNRRYQELIGSNFSRYGETVLNDRKRQIVYDIIDEITRNGRFLKRSRSNMPWSIQNREEMRSKVTRSLQDKYRTVRRAVRHDIEEPFAPLPVDTLHVIARSQTKSPVSRYLVDHSSFSLMLPHGVYMHDGVLTSEFPSTTEPDKQKTNIVMVVVVIMMVVVVVVKIVWMMKQSEYEWSFQ